MSNILSNTIALRDQAWRGVMESPHYKEFKALDDAVEAMGGSRMVATTTRPLTARLDPTTVAAVGYASGGGTRRTQGDAAEKALVDGGEPLPVGRLMEAAIKNGAHIGGTKPLISFRSTLSKDSRFYSLMRNNMYFWWLTDRDLPEGWNKALDQSGKTDTSASFFDDQEGGGDHAAKTN